MAGILDVPKTRINCSMLSQHIHRPVCFVGQVGKINPTGKSFTVMDGEGKFATVELNEPLDEELSGIVEIVGTVTNRGEIVAAALSFLRDDRGSGFDLELYNEALKLVHDFPQFYPFVVSPSE